MPVLTGMILGFAMSSSSTFYFPNNRPVMRCSRDFLAAVSDGCVLFPVFPDNCALLPVFPDGFALFSVGYVWTAAGRLSPRLDVSGLDVSRLPSGEPAGDVRAAR